MENASKALIIAGAILLSILIISLGIMIYNQAAGTVNNNAMSEVEKQQFNTKFTQYEGTNVKGTKVKSILRTVYAHNSQQDTKEKMVTAGHSDNYTDYLTYSSSSTSPDKAIAPAFSPENYEILDGSTYTVKCVYRDSNGLVKHLSITKNT